MNEDKKLRDSLLDQSDIIIPTKTPKVGVSIYTKDKIQSDVPLKKMICWKNEKECILNEPKNVGVVPSLEEYIDQYGHKRR